VVSSRSPRPGRIPSLDGLRALSIVLVLLSHLAGTRGFPVGRHAMHRFLDPGYLGVRIFFVISGYLITRLLLEERVRSGTISLAGFYARRAFRIFPAFLVFVAAMAVASALGLVRAEAHDFVYALTYTMNFHIPHSGDWALGHLWSLSVEEQFYLLWPALLLALGTRGGLRAATAMLVVAPACRYACRYALDRLGPSLDLLMSSTFPTVADQVATGCLLAGFEGKLDDPRWKRFATSPWFVVVPLAAVAAANAGAHPFVNLVLAQAFINVAVALCVHRVVRWPEGALGRLLNARPVALLGFLSYSLYLWQQPFLDRESDTWWCRFPLNIVLALAAATLSYRLVERPLRALWAHRAAAAATAPAAAPPALAPGGAHIRTATGSWAG
jgi:peptidoglycan/LPS O-acetylase OafA/YrhL